MTENASKPPTPGQQVWLEHLRACDAQGCSSVSYARSHGLSVSALYAARKDLVGRGAYQSGRPGRRKPRKRPESPVTLVPVQLRGSAGSAQAVSVLRVLLPNGLTVEVPQGAEPERCQALVAALCGVSR